MASARQAHPGILRARLAGLAKGVGDQDVRAGGAPPDFGGDGRLSLTAPPGESTRYSRPCTDR
jgi:hypothetical protein